MAEKDYESQKVTSKNLKGQEQRSKIYQLLSLLAKKNHRYSQLSGHQISIDIWSTDTHKYLVDRYTWISGRQIHMDTWSIPGIQKHVKYVWVCGSQEEMFVTTDDDVKSNNMTYTYTGSDFWSQTGSNQVQYGWKLVRNMVRGTSCLWQKSHLSRNPMCMSIWHMAIWLYGDLI